jgi:tungstate transport system ATP-binding protein
MTETYLYRLIHCKKRNNDDFVLEVPSLNLKSGESVGLVGHNGSGKSTLLRLLAFLDQVDEGFIRFNGEKERKKNSQYTRTVTLLLQEPYLLRRTVFDNIAFGMRVRNQRTGIKKRVYEALQLVGLSPEKFVHRRWTDLSGGETKRVALASRLVVLPKVLLLDEPTANVDHQSAAQIKNAVNSYRDRYNTTLVIASHDLIWLNGVTDRTLKMHDGHIVGRGTDNIVSGRWRPDKAGLWFRTLQDGQFIWSIHPPSANAIGILNSSNIMISNEPPESISAQNILRGTIANMSSEFEEDKVRVDINISDIDFACSVTHRAAETLNLLPGKAIWVVFKASSLHWH